MIGLMEDEWNNIGGAPGGVCAQFCPIAFKSHKIVRVAVSAFDAKCLEGHTTLNACITLAQC